MNHQKPIATCKSKIKVGISACLVGHTVRYNGGHSQSQLCMKTLDKYFSFMPFCPEVAAGFGTPRPTMRLTGDPDNPTLTFSNDQSVDITEQLKAGFQKVLPTFSELSGYILMKNSPSCGMERVKVYQANGHPHQQTGKGIFADALIKQQPSLPVEEEGRLNDPVLRENFILRVYAFYNFHEEVLTQLSYHNLLRFHASYKLILLAHNYEAYSTLGRMLADGKKEPLDALANAYLEHLMLALRKPAKRKNHTNVLMHILGYLKRSVPSTARQNIVSVIKRYHDGQVPLITPTTLLNHYVEQLGNSYIRSQRYLNPYPEELGLRNRL